MLEIIHSTQNTVEMQRELLVETFNVGTVLRLKQHVKLLKSKNNAEHSTDNDNSRDRQMKMKTKCCNDMS